MIRFASSLMAHCSSKDRPKQPTEKERSKLQTEKERPQAPAFQEHSFKSVPSERPTALVEHKSAKTPLSEQGDVKEEGIDLLVMPDD